jgi:restriction system protein
MALWLVRAGKKGEFETKFIESKRIYLTWDNLTDDLAALTKEDILGRLVQLYPEAKHKTLVNWRSQIWPFAHAMQVNDWVVLPSKHKSVIHVGRITGGYIHTTAEPNPFYHYRTIEWLALDVPRDYFDADLIFSFGAFLTICRIQRNDAEGNGGQWLEVSER